MRLHEFQQYNDDNSIQLHKNTLDSDLGYNYLKHTFNSVNESTTSNYRTRPRARLTLRHLHMMRLMTAAKRVEKIEQLHLMNRMYGEEVEDSDEKQQKTASDKFSKQQQKRALKSVAEKDKHSKEQQAAATGAIQDDKRREENTVAAVLKAIQSRA